MAAGVVAFAIIGVFLLLAFLYCAGSLRLSTALLGNKKPKYMACLGWVLATAFINTFITALFVVVFGQGATILVMPLCFCITLYIITIAADCGWIQAFAIHILNCFLSTVGIVLLLIGLTIPLAAIGAATSDGHASSRQATSEIEQPSDANQDDLPQATPVNLPAQTSPPTAVPTTTTQRVAPPTAPRPSTRARRTNDGSTANPFFNQ